MAAKFVSLLCIEPLEKNLQILKRFGGFQNTLKDHEMEKICINCVHVKWLAEDLETKDITDDNDVLICLHPFNVTSTRNINNQSAQRLEVAFYQVDDDDTCLVFMPCNERKKDLKDGC